MLSAAPSFETLALNRVTFGARDIDVQRIKQIGWKAWVEDQLHPPAGDDPDLAAMLDAQLMRIVYNGQPPTKGIAGWPDVNQQRPLNYLKADVSTLWTLVGNVEYSVAANELSRIQQELNAATWIRNTHSQYQVREVMADFWNNHFNVGRQADVYGSAALPIYDSQVIRPRALGNFRDLVEAVATSASMLKYLDNAASTASHPNENFARELLELHTLGRPAYFGITTPAYAGAPPGLNAAVNTGFSDEDVIQASRALSGWTLEDGQAGPAGTLPLTGKFTYNPLQHSAETGRFMGINLSTLADPMLQGRAVIEIAANHPATAAFVSTKIARRMFGDTPPQSVIDRATAAWRDNGDAPDQIARVVEAILLGGNEIGLPLAQAKLRRPYERLIAFFRTTDTLVKAFDLADVAVAALGDGLFVWPTPDGRPDVNAQWLTTSVNLYNWNLLLLILPLPAFATTLADQTPAAASASATSLVEHWVGRMVGYALRPQAMTALVNDVAGPAGALAAYRTGGIATIETALRRLVALIGSAPEFGFR